jgi:Holliday junction resolvase RusA-like endonuclease
MKAIEFVVPAVPTALPRKRSKIVRCKGGKVFAQTYTPTADKSNSLKALIAYAFSQVHQGPPLAGPVGLDVDFVFQRPASMVWKKKAMPRDWKPTTPDLSNLVKLVEDALNKLAFVDDAQIVDGRNRKLICNALEQPHIRVKIYCIEYLAEPLVGESKYEEKICQRSELF